MTTLYHIIVAHVDAQDNMETHLASFHDTDKNRCIENAVEWMRAPAIEYLTYKRDCAKNPFFPSKADEQRAKDYENKLANIDKELRDFALLLAKPAEHPVELLTEVDYCWHRFYVYELK